MMRSGVVVLVALACAGASGQEAEVAPPPPAPVVDPAEAVEADAPPPASPAAEPDTAPTDAAPSDAAPPDAAPPEVPALAPPAPSRPDDDEAILLRFSTEADASLARCVPLVAARDDAAARACLDRVLLHGDDTTAALRAAALRDVLDAGLAAAVPAGEGGDRDATAAPAAGGLAIPPGRLELSSTAGLFGVWNGIAAGVAIVPHLPDGNPAAIILGTGALAVGLGVGYGVGGYFLADALDLGEGDSRLVASSLIWGTTFGIAALPALLDVVQPSAEVGLSLSLGTVVASGFAVGGGALALASFTDLTTSHVSLINTGGWVGGLFGLLTIASLAPFEPPLPAYSAGYLAVAGGGLVAGALAGMVVDLSWGETLLLDLGGVLGTVTAGAIVMSLTASGALNGVPSTLLIPMNSALTAGGTLGGIGLGLAATTLFRPDDASVFKPFGGDVTLLPPMPTVVLDKDGDPAPMFLGPALIF